MALLHDISIRARLRAMPGALLIISPRRAAARRYAMLSAADDAFRYYARRAGTLLRYAGCRLRATLLYAALITSCIRHFGARRHAHYATPADISPHAFLHY